MSINSMTDIAVSARTQGIAGLDSKSVDDIRASYFQQLVSLIPTETIGFYVVAAAGITALKKVPDAGAVNFWLWLIFWIGVAVTPFFVWTAFAIKLKNRKQPLPLQPKTWPWWTMSAATVAFAAWAAGLPDSIFTDGQSEVVKVAIPLVVFLVAAILAALAPLFTSTDQG